MDRARASELPGRCCALPLMLPRVRQNLLELSHPSCYSLGRAVAIPCALLLLMFST